MKTTVNKTFLDIHKEEEWLNAQGGKGLMLIGCRGDGYEFEDVSPATYQYKIDLPDYTGSKRKDYFAFLEQAGITVVAEYGGRVYLRKNMADGPLDVYTEKEEVEKQMKKRYTHYFIIGVTQIFFGVGMELRAAFYDVKMYSAAFWITLIFGIAFTMSGLIFLISGIRRRRKYAMSKEEKGIWES